MNNINDLFKSALILKPFKVILGDDIDKLGTTERGEGGFGSTGV